MEHVSLTHKHNKKKHSQLQQQVCKPTSARQATTNLQHHAMLVNTGFRPGITRVTSGDGCPTTSLGEQPRGLKPSHTRTLARRAQKGASCGHTWFCWGQRATAIARSLGLLATLLPLPSAPQSSGRALDVLKCVAAMNRRGAALTALWQHSLAVCHLHRAPERSGLGKAVEGAEEVGCRLAALIGPIEAPVQRKTLELGVLENGLVGLAVHRLKCVTLVECLVACAACPGNDGCACSQGTNEVVTKVIDSTQTRIMN